MRIFGSRRELHILVENNGSLSEEDREKIASLLSRAEKMAEERRMGERNLGDKSIDSSSIGIRNVHLRLRMLYGKESGLSIRDSGDGRTVSEIIICRQEQTNESNQSQMSM